MFVQPRGWLIFRGGFAISSLVQNWNLTSRSVPFDCSIRTETLRIKLSFQGDILPVKNMKSKLLYLVKTCFLNNPVRIIVAISKDVHQLLPTPGQIFPLLPDIITHSELPLHWCVNNPIQPFVNCTFTKSRGSHRHTLGHRWNYGCDSWCCLWKATCTWHGQSVQEDARRVKMEGPKH